jgi:hypothetical protein
MAARVQLREITSEEGNRLLRIVRRTSGSVVTWRRAQIVLLSAQGMSPPKISEVVFTDPDTVRGCHPQLQRRRVRRALAALPWRAAADLHAAKAPGDQADRFERPPRSRPAVCDVEPLQARGLSGRRGGWSRTSPTRVCVSFFGRRTSGFKL